MLFLKYKTETFNKINTGGLANESIFAIILQTFGELTNPLKLINESSSVCDWKRMSTPTSPYVFKEATPENIDIIVNLLKENRHTMFLRKVDRSFPDSVIKDIMNMDFNHKIDILHNQGKKKIVYLYFIIIYPTFLF